LKDKLVLLRDSPDCVEAPNAPEFSDGNKMTRLFDHVCTALGSSNVGNICDNNFDGIFNETCTLGGRCSPSSGTSGGCGSGGGKCEGTVQLPSGKPYSEQWDVKTSWDYTIHQESRLTEGFYTICLCLGSDSTGYNGANGDGGCDTGNEFTRVFSPSVPGQTLKVISEPRLGRFEETHGQQTVRHIAGATHKYHIKASSESPGFQVADNDKIYFAPQSIGCGQVTKYSGKGTYEYIPPAVWNTSGTYSGNNVDRRWRVVAKHVCTSVDSDHQALCDTNGDGSYSEACAQTGALCNPANALNGGCGTNGACGSPIASAHETGRTALLSVTDYSDSTLAAVVTTPNDTALSTVQTLVACFATAESLSSSYTDVTDFVELQDGLEVMQAPRLGPVATPGDVSALEQSSPSFTVNTMKYGDLIYFVPKIQVDANYDATWHDCNRYVCTMIGESNVGTNCDATYDGAFNDKCVMRARCNPSNEYNGGCGAGGACEILIPTTSTSIYTGLLNGTSFVSSDGTGQIVLPTSPQLIVPPYDVDGALPSAWYLATCFIPAGAIQTLPYNVQPLEDMLTIFKEPTDSLTTSWFQYNVQELKFTQPQQGTYNTPSFATGQEGDIVVVQLNNCTGVHLVHASGYMFSQNYSSRFYLRETGGETLGDEKGGSASVLALAEGKVNELQPGIYKICYATKGSLGDSQTDFKELEKQLEILPPPDTQPRLTVPRTVILGQDIVIHWEANIGLQTRVAPPNTWVGLYAAGDCSEENEWRHQCYKAFQFLDTQVESGTVRFSLADYKIAGEYDVRYFAGDTRNGQGEICKGLVGVEHETYVQCVLNPSVTSSTIHIHGPDLRDLEDLESQPGMEVVFAGNRGRFN